MECYLEGCTNQALKEERCFAYCCIEHKAKVVMVDFDEENRRPGNLKEIQLGLKRMKQNYLNKKMMEEGK
jgi:hypothetical protein